MSSGAGPRPGLRDPGKPFIMPMSADSVAVAMRSHKAMLQTVYDDSSQADGARGAGVVEGSGEQGSAPDVVMGHGGVKRSSAGAAHVQHPTSQGDPGSAGSARAISNESPNHQGHGPQGKGSMGDHAASGQEGVSNGTGGKHVAGFHMPAYMSENQMNALAGRQPLVEEADAMKTMMRRMDEVAEGGQNEGGHMMMGDGDMDADTRSSESQDTPVYSTSGIVRNGTVPDEFMEVSVDSPTSRACQTYLPVPRQYPRMTTPARGGSVPRGSGRVIAKRENGTSAAGLRPAPEGSNEGNNGGSSARHTQLKRRLGGAASSDPYNESDEVAGEGGAEIDRDGMLGISRDADGSGRGRRSAKKQRLVWSSELHARFLNAVNHLGIQQAVPKTILQLMNVEGMTRENVASHLQKYRLYLKRLAGLPANAPLPAHVAQQVMAQQQAGQLPTSAGGIGMGPPVSAPHSISPTLPADVPMTNAGSQHNVSGGMGGSRGNGLGSGQQQVAPLPSSKPPSGGLGIAATAPPAPALHAVHGGALGLLTAASSDAGATSAPSGAPHQTALVTALTAPAGSTSLPVSAATAVLQAPLMARAQMVGQPTSAAISLGSHPATLATLLPTTAGANQAHLLQILLQQQAIGPAQAQALGLDPSVMAAAAAATTAATTSDAHISQLMAATGLGTASAPALLAQPVGVAGLGDLRAILLAQQQQQHHQAAVAAALASNSVNPLVSLLTPAGGMLGAAGLPILGGAPASAAFLSAQGLPASLLGGAVHIPGGVDVLQAHHAHNNAGNRG